MRAKGTSISLRVRHRRRLLHILAREVRVWVEVEDRAHGLRLQGSKGVFTLSHHRLSQLISQLYRVCFYYLAYGQRYCLILVHHIFFVAASSVDVLVLEVDTLEKSFHVSSPLWTRVGIDQICQDCELEISGILLTMDLRVMDILDFDGIFGMDWLTTHRVVIDCDNRRITIYTRDGIRVTFQEEKHDALP